MGALERLPGWAKRLDEMSGHFTEAGLNGLLDYHAETNTLGELLAQGIVKPVDLRVWFTEQVGKQKPDGGGDTTVAAQALLGDPRAFWEQVWEAILKRKVNIPPAPTLKGKIKTAILGGMWIPIYLPAKLTEADYPADFVKPVWGKYLTESDIQRRPLPGRWVIVETILKPNWDDQNGYGNGNDPLAQTLGLESRFKVSWDDLHEAHLHKTAKLLGLSKRAVRLTTAEEWQWIAYVFLWLNTNRNMNLPHLGSTNSWEWTENSYGGGHRLIVGDREYGGLAGVSCSWHGVRDDYIGFRVLAVL